MSEWGRGGAGRERGSRGWVNRPQQGRSRKTLDRIAEATQALLEEKRFEEVSVADIVKRARSSVGAFYARFPDKTALLHYLDERYAEELTAVVTQVLAPAPGDGRSAAVVVRGFVSEMVQFHRAKRGLLRTLVLSARASDDPAFRERTQRMNLLIHRLHALLLARRSEMKHPRPTLAVKLGFLLAFSALREKILFDEGPAASVSISDRDLVEEITHAFLAYLGVQVPAERRGRKGGES